MARGDGTTTDQMTKAPFGAVYVWVNSALDYPRQLAKHLGRTDLKIISPHQLTDHTLDGIQASCIIRDHACWQWSQKEWDMFRYFEARFTR